MTSARTRAPMLGAVVLSAWLQYAADGKPHARAVTDGGCPALRADDREIPMQERAPKGGRFTDAVCDGAVPEGARRVEVGGRALPAPAHDPRTIVVFGDTGCRITLLQVQACNNARRWPFPRVARAAAALKPDLVVHVGDYLYRESGCPPLTNCAGSPHGDDTAAWDADFLTPAAPLFAAAPLLLARGNHEECGRNGTGWFRYFEPHEGIACRDAQPPFDVDLGALRIVSFDSAIAEDTKTDPKRLPEYRAQFEQARAMAHGETWFLTHRPPYTNDDERTAMGDALAPFEAVLSGHIHFFAAMNVARHPPLLINGEGGTQLDPNYAPLLGFAVGNLTLDGPPFGIAQNGFGVYTRTGNGWSISLRNPDGIERAHCSLEGRAVRCARTPPATP